MQADARGAGDERPLRFEEAPDPDFQKMWQEARHLDGEEVERAFTHGLAARERFAERPFREVEGYLRESWEALGGETPWDKVFDIVASGYDRARAASLPAAADLPPEAEERFNERTTGGSSFGGQLGGRNFLGAAEPVSEYDGEGGPPVEKGRRVRD